MSSSSSYPGHLRNPVNRHLIGVPGGRHLLNTPALILDLDRFQANLSRMAAHCRQSRIALRPHAKTHKSIDIAKLQIAHGAVGICCAKLGEAEVFSAGGVESILITSPVVTLEGGRRLARLNETTPDLMTVVDSIEGVRMLEGAARASGRRLRLLVDLEVGLLRTGVATPQLALELASRIEESEFLEFVGLQAYAGHLMHVGARAERQEQTLAVMAQIAATVDLLESRGVRPQIVSGGGTGTFDLDPPAGVLTELQAGSYIFMDNQYNSVWRAAEEEPPFATSLFVQTTVISANLKNFATTDAGLKAFATDDGVPMIVRGAPADARYVFMGDEQGGIEYAEASTLASVGDTIVCAVPHCDPTVNLYDHYHVIKDEVLIDIWSIQARGCSQ